MLSNLSTIFLKINNIRLNEYKVVNAPLLSSPYTKKNINNYIAISNQKSFEIYSKYNKPKFSVLELNKDKNTNIKKYINPVSFFIGCYYIFLASFSENRFINFG
jgi:hypothetical protein